MSSRRNFLNISILAALSTSMGFTVPPKKGTKKNPHSVKGFPISIATWGKNTGAVNAAMLTIDENKTALDAVEAGGRVPEADPNDTSVGYGGLPDRDGNVTLDACIMDEKGNAGSVTYLQNIMHPVSVARRVMEKTPHVMLSGEGAYQFAISEGFPKENLLTEKSKTVWEEWKKTSKYQPIVNVERHDTIGILAIDKKGNISGACTTSGMAFKMQGRVGDSPIIGAGMFVDNEVGGACATGVGELVLKTLGSFLVVELMRQGFTPQEACEEAVNRIVKKNKDKNLKDYQVGYLAINKKGEHGAYCIQSGFDYAINQGGKTQVFESNSFMK
jgi:N4-(beta-N-acetylglucosaminyl)-L-asparaginase